MTTTSAPQASSVVNRTARRATSKIASSSSRTSLLSAPFAWLLACFLFAGLSGMWAWGSASPPQAIPSVTAEPLKPIGQPIETIRVGQAVLATNPIEEADLEFGTSVDPSSWKHVFLIANKENGQICEIELLRPDTWIVEQQVTAGGSLHISVPECGIDSEAQVVRLASCPQVITPLPGYRIVTGVFRHDSAIVVDLYIDSLRDPIAVTGTHPFYSEDREAFVPAAELNEGERVATAAGTARVTRQAKRAGSQPVYNLEVQVDHTYHVSASGVLVHNSASGPHHRFIQGLIGRMKQEMTEFEKKLTTFAAARVRLPDGSIETWVSGAGVDGEIRNQLRFGYKHVAESGVAADQNIERIRDAERHILRRARKEGAEVLNSLARFWDE